MGPLHLAIVLGCAALISAAGTGTGKCPVLKAIEKFDVDKYVGLWYEIQTVSNVNHLPGKCVAARYNKLKNATVEVINSMCILDNKISIVGNVKEESNGSLVHGKFSVSFPVMGPNRESPYYVLDTDYVGYSIVWSCQQLETGPQEQHVQSLWVLGKDTKLNDAQKATVTKKLKELELDSLKLTDTDQTNCCYDATADDDGNSGKCPVMKTIEKFDVDKYVGLWYEIQKVPNVKQLPGKCVAARYNKLKNGTVEAINSMCVLGNKMSVVGNVKEESNGSFVHGKFSVSFPVMGPNRESPYYVLDTDYDSYSIVWSCQESETDPKEQHVQSLWVLGKDTKLNDTQKTKVTEKLKELGLDTLKLTDTDQTNCCYDATKYDDGNSAASVGLSMALLLSTIMVRFL